MTEFKLNKFYPLSILNGLLMILVVSMNINSRGIMNISRIIMTILALCLTPIFIAPKPKNNDTVEALFNAKKHMYVIFSLFIPAAIYLFTLNDWVILSILIVVLIAVIILFYNAFILHSLRWCLKLEDEHVYISYGKKSLRITWQNIHSIETYKLLGAPHICILPKDEHLIQGKFQLIDRIRNAYLNKKIISIPMLILGDNADIVKALLKDDLMEKGDTN